MPQLFLWGERGLVSSLFFDLSTTNNLDCWRTFLAQLKPSIDCQELENVWAVVEPDFGNKGFGHPDAIVKLIFRNLEPLVLLVEAKMTTFVKSSWPSNKRRDKGFNSRINGQIELNHRLALALADFDSDIHDRLEEPVWVVETCYETANPTRPNYVKKRVVLDQLARPIAGLAFERYLHLCITTDTSSPWNALLSNRRPLLLRQDGEESWHSTIGRFHWISWSILNELTEAWGDSTFRSVYGFHQAVFERPQQIIEETVIEPGVYLVQLNPDIYAPSTCIHLSWNGKAYRLRDYSGSRVVGIRPACDAPTLLSDEGILRRKRYEKSERKRWQDYDWWRKETNTTNSEWGLE